MNRPPTNDELGASLKDIIGVTVEDGDLMYYMDRLDHLQFESGLEVAPPDLFKAAHDAIKNAFRHLGEACSKGSSDRLDRDVRLAAYHMNEARALVLMPTIRLYDGYAEILIQDLLDTETPVSKSDLDTMTALRNTKRDIEDRIKRVLGDVQMPRDRRGPDNTRQQIVAQLVRDLRRVANDYQDFWAGLKVSYPNLANPRELLKLRTERDARATRGAWGRLAVFLLGIVAMVASAVLTNIDGLPHWFNIGTGAILTILASPVGNFIYEWFKPKR